MQISIQSLEITHNETPYRFIVKKIFNTTKNEVSFHCWAPEDNLHAKELIKSDVLLFEWDGQNKVLRSDANTPVSDELRQAIKENFSFERA